MAIWEIPSDQEINYSPNGDDVDAFSQKVKYCLEQIFECLRILRASGAQAGLDDSEASPYEIRINTADNCIYIRDGENKNWILLGDVDNHFGLTPETISAVRNGGNMGQLLFGTEAELPQAGNETNDLFFASDTSRVYRWTGSAWVVFLSKHFSEILNYEQYCVARTELTSVGGAEHAGQVLQLDKKTGKANVDITGSPERLLGYEIDVQDLKDGDALVFNAQKKKIVNLPNYKPTNDPDVKSNLYYDVAHLTRLVENLYLALNVAGLDPGGYDALNPVVFCNGFDEIDRTSVQLRADAIKGDVSLTVSSVDGLIEGGEYLLRNGYSGSVYCSVRIKTIIVGDGINRVILYDGLGANVSYQATGGVFLVRSITSASNGKISSATGDGNIYTTKPIVFVNEVTGKGRKINRAHLAVKHENVLDAEIKAEIALRNATFVKDEVIGVGDGTTQTVTLANTNELTAYNFALYFDGVKQTSGYTFTPSTGQVTFTAGSYVVVTADYFYDRGAENFVEMVKTGTYADRTNSARATTEFTFEGDIDTVGTLVTLRLTLKQPEGTDEISVKSTGKMQAVKLPHKAVSGSVTITPTPNVTNGLISFAPTRNTVMFGVTPAGRQVKISYRWQTENFSVDSFGCTFNE